LYRTFEDNSSTEGSETGVYEYRATLPEDNYNLNKVTQDFYFTSGDSELSFVMYPVYWQTSAANEVGVVYLDGEEKKHVPVYTIKSGDELCGLGTWTFYNTYNVSQGTDQVNKGSSNTTSTIYLKDNDDYKDYPIDLSISPEQYSDNQKKTVKEWVIERLDLPSDTEFGSSFSDEVCLIFQTGSVYVQYTGDVWFPITYNESTKTGGGEADYTKFRSQGIKVTIPANTNFGFYITNGENTMYSTAEWNGDSHVHAATFINKSNERCIAFEDWYNGPLSPAAPTTTQSGGGDLNDVVFYTTLATTTTTNIIVNDPANSYILAAEDLGNIDDFDFNDLVVKVTYTSGKIQEDGVKIDALAAGGTLPLHLCYKDKDGAERIIEGADGKTTADNGFHSCFGDGTLSVGTMINTGGATATGKTYTFYDFPEDFSMAANQKFSADDKGAATNMGGFYIKVKHDGTETDADGYTTTVTAPALGDAPQMICVGDSWKWPLERKNIKDAYTKFSDWCSDSTTDWYSPVDDSLIY